MSFWMLVGAATLGSVFGALILEAFNFLLRVAAKRIDAAGR